jgi:hypothetical protein
MAQRLEASRKGAKAKGRRQRKNDEREEGKEKRMQGKDTKEARVGKKEKSCEV